MKFEVELEVAYELSSRLLYLPDFVFFPTWYVIFLMLINTIIK